MYRSILGPTATALLTISGLATTVLLTTAAHAVEPVDVRPNPQAAASANLIDRADRALRDYIAACSSGGDEAIARVVTSDAMVEYALDEPGTYLAVEAAALSANRSSNANQTRPGARISNLWIFPTPDSNTVFVHYTTSVDGALPAELPDSEHLALLEMRGDRIVKIRNSSADAGALSSLEASVITRAIASSRATAHD